jgi:hypothetical protein
MYPIMVVINNISSSPSSSSSNKENIENDYKSYSMKKGIGFGAFGGFIAAIAFTGIILFLSVFFNFPAGSFLVALGEIVSAGYNNIDVSVITGMTGFSLILFQGIVLGIIFGALISSIKKFYPINKKKGIIEGLVMGFISFLIIGLPLVYSLSSNMDEVLANYPDSLLSTKGSNNYNMALSSVSAFFPITINMFIIGYLFYGFLLGGIITLAYSIYHFDIVKIKESKEVRS